MNKIITAVILTTLVGPVLAQQPITKCERDGKTSYLQGVCGNNTVANATAPVSTAKKYRYKHPTSGKEVTQDYPPAWPFKVTEERGNEILIEVQRSAKPEHVPPVKLEPTPLEKSEPVPPLTPLAVASAADLTHEDKINLAVKRAAEIRQRGSANPDDLKAFLDAIQRFDDARGLAHNASRISLSEPIARMQDIRQEVERQPVDACHRAARRILVTWMNTLIDEAMAFMSGKGDEVLTYTSTKQQEARDKLYDFWLSIPLESLASR